MSDFDIEELICLESTYLKLLMLKKIAKRRFCTSRPQYKRWKVDSEIRHMVNSKSNEQQILNIQPEPVEYPSHSNFKRDDEGWHDSRTEENIKEKPNNQKRRYSSHPLNTERTVHGEYHHLYQDLREDPENFFEYMKMSIETFDYIHDATYDTLSKHWRNCHARPIMPAERLMLTIRYLSSGLSFRNLSFSFRMGASTVSTIIKEVVKVLWQTFQPLHMKLPSKQGFLKISEEYRKLWNFPHCLGAIDCRDIQVNSSHSGSVVLQAIADANYKFINIEIGGYRTEGYTGSFKSSSFYTMLCNQLLDIPENDALPNTAIAMPYAFIGDEAYPLMENLLKPYNRLQLDPDKDCFNSRLSRAQRTIECAFDLMYSKWRLLAKDIDTEVTTAEDIIKGICILHNIVIDKEGVDLDSNDPITFPKQYKYCIASHGRPTTQAQYIRDVFKTFVCQNEVLNNINSSN